MTPPPIKDPLLDDIYQPKLRPMLDDQPIKAVFKPWHKARKQYIRLYQWAEPIRRLIRQLGYGNGHHLTYLGLPGEDLFDIRALHGVCEGESVGLKYIGFDSTFPMPRGKRELELSQHEVYDLAFIHPSSKVVKDRFERIAVQNTIAWKRAYEFAPFDVLNIDLCDCVASMPEDSDGSPPYFDALAALFTLQISNRTRPWLFFLTTRAVREQMQSVTKLKLLNTILRNANENPPFREKMRNDLGLTERAIVSELNGTKLLDHDQLVKAFCLGIGKWLLNYMLGAQPFLKVEMLRSYSYTVEPRRGGADMLSLAFCCEPLIEPRIDRTGISGVSMVQMPPSPLSETELAMSVLTEVLQIENVDVILSSNDGLREKMIKQSIALLAAAGYDTSSYPAWERGDGAVTL